MRSISSSFAKFITTFRYKDIPEEVLRKLKQCTLDVLGVSLAGSRMPWSHRVVNFLRDLSGQEQSTIINYGDRVPAADCAFANGTFAHSIEMDDEHAASITHPSSVLVPVALAVGERENVLTGKNF